MARSFGIKFDPPKMGITLRHGSVSLPAGLTLWTLIGFTRRGYGSWVYEAGDKAKYNGELHARATVYKPDPEVEAELLEIAEEGKKIHAQVAALWERHKAAVARLKPIQRPDR